MITIYKYPLPINSTTHISMPAGAIVRHIGCDPAGEPCLWAEVDTDHPMENRIFHVMGTGHPCPEFAYDGHPRDRFFGSFVQGVFVWHVFLG